MSDPPVDMWVPACSKKDSIRETVQPAELAAGHSSGMGQGSCFDCWRAKRGGSKQKQPDLT